VSETIDIQTAEQCMAEAIALADDATAPQRPLISDWIARVEQFSELCERVGYRTSIAVLGNALLAKAANPRVDVFSLKASADHPGAFDARRSAERVLVPASQRSAFHLGVTGPQPLNNQPFFRSQRIESRMVVRPNAQPLIDLLLTNLQEIALMRRPEAIEALAGFVIVRRRYVPVYPTTSGAYAVDTFERLAAACERFVAARSEGGGRAQACAAGLLDATFGDPLVRLGRRNEPDRDAPGDIGLRTRDGDDAPYGQVLEVRDKPVHDYTIQPVAQKAAAAGVPKAAVIAIAHDQGPVDERACADAARAIGVDLRLFTSWRDLIASLSAWSPVPERTWVECAISSITSRLEQIGLPAETVSEWLAAVEVPQVAT
jgi:hypothetical protein